ncbi:LD-carboxypeptidase [Desertifilum sp. FACHB-1129]|uniref:LD-carboxypeptidase n=2 Tax=Desertifilaceae TaxID=1969992 RepID=A0A1E5QF29_9CYAN|nr:LD-carboxypeptidase [Desertifilum sp. FACHB-1129]MBD2321737.1 LD-carboxypeptidase [Desertifilum sp. FACHB-866]MBD2331864.1 LD-carboxypeptidase [Desertifilum sp. FACHB-868]MDA0212804.1 LD-carboxypeptidase [Cyanobacteria bacterium FC1]OEJ73285.1 LD-carboxypeptidase [Desertifilum tharense IPPAS B-1220]
MLPTPLKPGDKLCMIAPSGALREFEAFQRGVEIWRKRGYVIEPNPTVDKRWGYLAGTDEHRREQLTEALRDRTCRGILCVRGGYGGARLLENWVWPESSPKWLIGFSDITSLLWRFYQAGVSGVHGPVLTTLAAEPEWSLARLFDWVEGRSLEPLQGEGWGGGEVQGTLIPANLTVATHLLGTPVQPNFQGAILALEDVTEAPYRIDRQLTQWRMCGAFEGVKGIALGRFSRCESPEGIPSFTIEEVLRDRLSDLGIPIVSDLPFGHDGVNAALPVGVCATLNGDTGSLTLSKVAC